MLDQRGIRLGQPSIHLLAHLSGAAKSTIHSRAHKERWRRDLSDKLAQQKETAAERSTSTQTRSRRERDVEGVFLVSEGKAKFTPVETGLQGDLVIEVVSGLNAGDKVITGPFRVLRQLKDDELVEPKKDSSEEDEADE